MKASKPLASVVAAAAVVGAIGLAYAQAPGTAADTSGQAANQGTQGTSTDTTGTTGTTGSSGSTMSNSPSSSTTTNDTAGFQTERPAQADRN